MFAASNVSIREKVVLAAGASLLAVLCACATTSAPQSSPVPETAVISELQVEKEGGATIVSLLGLAEPVYTAFQQDDPPRIVVDLSQVRPGAISDAISVCGLGTHLKEHQGKPAYRMLWKVSASLGDRFYLVNNTVTLMSSPK